MRNTYENRCFQQSLLYSIVDRNHLSLQTLQDWNWGCNFPWKGSQFMGNLIKKVNSLLHGMIAVCLSCMTIFVFANVILRYFFNSGLTWAEEASRYLFIWLIFLGAIVAYRENVHLGVDTLVQKLSITGRKRLFVINNILLLVTMGLCVDGTWKLTMLTVDQVSASMRLPLAWVYVSGFIASLSMSVISLHNLYRAFANKLVDKDLVMITDSEDNLFIDQVISGSAKGDRKL